MSYSMLIENLEPTQCNLIQETSRDDNDKSLWLKGIWMQGGILNRNGRIYPINEMATAVETAQKIIKERNGIFGELDHPQTLTINLDRVSHAITELYLQGNDVYGKAKILPTPTGNIAKTLLESGVRFGVSSRGSGTLTETPDGQEVSAFNFITADLVATPSAPGAMPTSVLESLELNQYGRSAIKLSEQVVNDPAAQEYLKKEILKFLSSVTDQFTKK